MDVAQNISDRSTAQPALTCLIPTHNRPQFLRRMLQFYSQFPPGFSFLVVDSGNAESAAEHLAIVESWKTRLDVEYRFIDVNFVDKCARGLELVRTPYVVLCAHDDLLFPDAVWKCVEFLKNEPTYSSAIGRTAEMHPHRPHWTCRVLKAYPIEEDCPFERCRRIAANWFNNFYAVYRTANLLDMIQITAGCTDYAFDYSMHEYMLPHLNALRGRVKVLPLMYQLQTRHGANASAGKKVGNRPQAEFQYQRFRECLATQFVHAGIRHETAVQFIDNSYGFFRAPTWETRVLPRSTAAVMRRCLHFLHGLVEKGAALWRPGFDRHRRFIRTSDLVGCEPIWNAAVKLIQEYPHGVPSTESPLIRIA